MAVAATAFTAWVALTVSTSALRARVDSQIQNAAGLLARSDFALNPAVLRSAKAITGADVVTVSADGGLLATTLDRTRAAATAAIIMREHLAHTSGVVRTQCDVPCAIATRPVSSMPGSVVAVVVATTEEAATTRAVTRAIVIAALVSLLLMLLVSQIVARRVTAPIGALARLTTRVSLEGTSERADAGTDEVGTLGRAFNEMLDRVEESRQALVQSEKLGLAGLFAARVAHDIRNPLSSIKMQTQLLLARLEKSSDAPTLASLSAIQRDVLQVESVVRDLLELARPGALMRLPSNLNDVVSETVKQVMPQLTYHRVTVDLRLAPALAAIPLDVERLRQALLNLINNAADAMPTGGTLTVSTRPVNESFVELEVADTGIGIDADVLPRVFDPFVSTKRDGMGLGLVNAKAVVEHHGGEIDIRPNVPRGTRVTIRLPMREEAHG